MNDCCNYWYLRHKKVFRLLQLVCNLWNPFKSSVAPDLRVTGRPGCKRLVHESRYIGKALYPSFEDANTQRSRCFFTIFLLAEHVTVLVRKYVFRLVQPSI